MKTGEHMGLREEKETSRSRGTMGETCVDLREAFSHFITHTKHSLMVKQIIECSL